MIIATVSFLLPGGIYRTRHGEAAELICTQVLNITEECYNAIIGGQSEPSQHALKEAGLVHWSQGKVHIDKKRWNQMSPYHKLLVFYSDLKADLGASDMKIHFIS